MKLLLTSAGIRNKTIKSALEELIGKELSESTVCYIPTASIGDVTPHDWFVQEIKKAYDVGWREFNLLELNGLPKDIIHERVQKSDVIYAEGGNLYYLARSIIDNDLGDIFQDIFENKVYVGVSAGSMIFSKNVSPKSAKIFDEESDLYAKNAESPFNFFDWYLKPHLYSKEFPKRTDAWIKAIAKRADFPIYAIDDETAIKVIDSEIEVIGEGKWQVF